jgi:hypothetical protein
MALSAVYLAQYSKDSIALLLSGIVILTGRTRRGGWCLVLAVIAYAVLFRTYWFGVLLLYFVYLTLLRHLTYVRALLAGVFVGIGALAVAIQIQFGQHVDVFRVTVNATQARATDVHSLISPVISGGSAIVSYLNSVITFFTLSVPVPLLTHGGIIYLLAGAVVIFVTVRVIDAARSLDSRASKDDADVLQGRRYLSLVLSFWTTQAVYVPDYGSSVKHLTPVLTLVVATLAITDSSRLPAARTRARQARSPSAAPRSAARQVGVR